MAQKTLNYSKKHANATGGMWVFCEDCNVEVDDSKENNLQIHFHHNLVTD